MGLFNKKDDESKLIIHLNKQAEDHVIKGEDLFNNGKLDEAKKEYEQALRLEPETSGAHFGMGMIYQQKGLLDEAATCYNKALKADPYNTAALFNIGSIHLFRRDYEKAVDIFKILSEFTPDDPQVFFNLGSAYLGFKQPDNAISSLQEALRLDPNYANAKIVLEKANRLKY